MEMIMGPHSGALDADQLLAAYPWPETRWVRALMVTDLDGGSVGADGLSGSISSDADREVFDAVRRHADAVLVGAATLREEGYGAMRAKPEDQDARRVAGQAAAPVIAAVSGSLDLPWDSPLFADSEVTPIVITSGEPDATALSRAHEHATVLHLGQDDLTPQRIIDALLEHGLRRIVCEGGPRLLNAFVEAGLIDEVDLTVSPVFAGTEASPQTPMLASPRPFRLAHVIHGDGSLMNRYVRAAP